MIRNSIWNLHYTFECARNAYKSVKYSFYHIVYNNEFYTLYKHLAWTSFCQTYKHEYTRQVFVKKCRVSFWPEIYEGVISERYKGQKDRHIDRYLKAILI